MATKDSPPDYKKAGGITNNEIKDIKGDRLYTLILIVVIIISVGLTTAFAQVKSPSFSLFGDLTIGYKGPSNEYVNTPNRELIEDSIRYLLQENINQKSKSPPIATIDPRVMYSLFNYPRNISITNTTPSTTFPQNISVDLKSFPQSNHKELEVLINEKLKTLRSDFKNYANSLNNKKNLIVVPVVIQGNSVPSYDMVKIIKWLVLSIIVFFIILYLTRLHRYYIKLGRHYKDRKLGFELAKENIPLEVAMMITSSAHIDFNMPKMPTDILTQYFASAKEKNGCCCCCCKKCKCEDKSQATTN